jgi:hypothetical protein
MFDSIEPTGVRWSNGAFHEADAIIWSTGFRPELRHLAPLHLREKEGGVSVANGTSWKDSRIFFAGYGPQASTVGANRAGRTIARQAVAALSRFGRERREQAEATEVARRAAEARRVEAQAVALARQYSNPTAVTGTWPDANLPALRLGAADDAALVSFSQLLEDEDDDAEREPGSRQADADV